MFNSLIKHTLSVELAIFKQYSNKSNTKPNLITLFIEIEWFAACWFNETFSIRMLNISRELLFEIESTTRMAQIDAKQLLLMDDALVYVYSSVNCNDYVHLYWNNLSENIEIRNIEKCIGTLLGNWDNVILKYTETIFRYLQIHRWKQVEYFFVIYMR